MGTFAGINAPQSRLADNPRCRYRGACIKEMMMEKDYFGGGRHEGSRTYDQIENLSVPMYTSVS